MIQASTPVGKGVTMTYRGKTETYQVCGSGYTRSGWGA